MAFDELRVLQFTLSTEIISVIDILKFVKYAYYYLKVSITYRILLTVSMTESNFSHYFHMQSIIGKKFFKIEVD
jgi:hypothetical protein